MDTASFHFVLMMLNTRDLFTFSMCSKASYERVLKSYTLQQHWWHVLKKRQFKRKRNYLQDIIIENYKRKLTTKKHMNFVIFQSRFFTEDQLPQTFTERAEQYGDYLKRRESQIEAHYLRRITTMMEDHEQYIEQMMRHIEQRKISYAKCMQRHIDERNSEREYHLRLVSKLEMAKAFCTEGHLNFFKSRIKELRDIQSKRHSLKRAAEIDRLHRLVRSNLR